MRKLAAFFFGFLAFHFLFFSNRTGTFFPPWPGSFGFSAFILTAAIALPLAFYSGGQRRHMLATWGVLAASGLAILSMFRANWVTSSLLAFTGLVLLLMSLYLYSLKHNIFGALTEFFIAPLIVFINYLSRLSHLGEYLEILINGVKTLFSIIGQGRGLPKGVVRQIVIGLALGIPFIFLIVTLLSGADPIFGKVISETFSIKLPELSNAVVQRLIFSGLFLVIVLPILFLQIKSKFISPFQSKKLTGFSVQAVTVLAMVSVVLGLFIVVQFKYVFATVPETELRQFGINTYSEYVRRGFSELLLVSVITYFAAFISLAIYRANRDKFALKALNIFLLSEILVFIFSIFRRVYLYQLEHGLTRIRIYGSIFLILMIILTLILILRHLNKSFVNWYLYEILAVIGTIFVIGFVNVDNLIATAFPPTVNGEKDYVYISRLSADTSDGLLAAYNHARGEWEKLSRVDPVSMSDDQVRRLVYSCRTLSSVQGEWVYLSNRDKSVREDIKELNIAERVAYLKLKEFINEEELGKLVQDCNNARSRIAPREGGVLDRSSDTPLLR